ncbi:DUF4258 domain-containing protein [Spirochaeta cellobiosiphila]|uniref:DUF4258 domain-containing protein n=1 Tax=Spirochaeta cellobiosiphila TaxID=504483 RepID=UPI00040E6325|nr:DUF4258 domain-containing protein [Spirochaeta cellobiosiphila]
MFGNNTTHSTEIIYTNHAIQRIAQRHISLEAVELTRKYGTETIDDGARKVIIDLDACSFAEEDGVNLFPFFFTTIVVSMDNVLKTAYLKNI